MLFSFSSQFVALSPLLLLTTLGRGAFHTLSHLICSTTQGQGRSALSGLGTDQLQFRIKEWL